MPRQPAGLAGRASNNALVTGKLQRILLSNLNVAADADADAGSCLMRFCATAFIAAGQQQLPQLRLQSDFFSFIFISAFKILRIRLLLGGFGLAQQFPDRLIPFQD